MLPFEVFPWNGLQVNIVKDRPRMQLSEDCPVTEEFRAETNAWMVSFFGTTCNVPDGVVYQNTTTGQLFCNERTADLIRRAVDMDKTMDELKDEQASSGTYLALNEAKPRVKTAGKKPRKPSKHFKHIPRR